MPDPVIVIEIIGEGVTDLGEGDDRPSRPDTGVLPIFIHMLCERSDSLRVRRKRFAFLQGKGLEGKLKFNIRQAPYNGSAGIVFVLDTEGDHPRTLERLQRGRTSASTEYPVAVGVAHPCIEAWLLADPAAIRRALELPRPPVLPEPSESLPAPCQKSGRDPKSILGRLAERQQPLSAADTTKIALAIRDLGVVRDRCQLSFAPFADEILRYIKPLFISDQGAESP